MPVDITNVDRRKYALAMIEGDIAALPPEEREKYHAVQAEYVFGSDHRKDRHGEPIEQGFGAPGHETGNHFAALRKREQQGEEEPGTTDRLLAEYRARKKGTAPRSQIIAPPAANRRRGNPAGLVKARAAAAAKREAAAAEHKNG
jgi:hypothetical protein